MEEAGEEHSGSRGCVFSTTGVSLSPSPAVLGSLFRSYGRWSSPHRAGASPSSQETPLATGYIPQQPHFQTWTPSSASLLCVSHSTASLQTQSQKTRAKIQGSLLPLEHPALCLASHPPHPPPLPQHIWNSLDFSSQAATGSTPEPREHLELVMASEIRQPRRGILFYYLFRNT